MKKSLLFAAALVSFAANAEVYNYGFQNSAPNAEFPFLNQLSDATSDFYFPGNYNLVNQYGVALPETYGLKAITVPEGETKGVVETGLAISFLDGNIYKLSESVQPGGAVADVEVMPEENFKYPFLSWGSKGVTRTIFMPGWGTEDAWSDADYNSAVESDWIATKNGVQFTRLGTDGIVSRQDTYIQYPAVSGKVTVTVWAGCNLGGNANPDNVLKVAVTPVFDGVADEEQTVHIQKNDPANKRYYKLDPVTFDATGKNLAVRVGADGAQLNLMYVRIEGEPATSAIEDIIANDVDENAPVYNVMGIQVDENYKGVVIKNGKKYIQR